MNLKVKLITLKRGLLAKLQAAGLSAGEPAVIWDDTSKPRLAVGDRDGVPREVVGAAHSHAPGEVTGLEVALAGKASSTHSHAISEVTDLTDALSGKAAASHTHAISDTTGLQDALDAKAAASHSHAASAVSGIQAAANQRQTVTLTLSAATGTVDLGRTFEVLDESASAPGRFRLYRGTAGRDSDLARAVEVQEPNTVGLLLEDVFLAAALSVAEDPAPCAAGSDGLCAWSWSGDLGSTVTLTILVKEA